MTDTKVRGIITILIISVALIVMALIALAPIFGGYPTADFTDHLKTWGSLCSGLVGSVVGFYFGGNRVESKK